ncbi:MAG TPA: hypothetical protein VMU57_16500 [Edaphobacter sp.]|uniref:hypothetical protein n=1 Tax=Edaphobacter sp. TaxID=1934404 RepID=UPI002CAFF27A|nr:hypothetical protein [Edaphobacter sp.]HUZ96504.1 hypothetical protein [Edaphobacter sp.]
MSELLLQKQEPLDDLRKRLEGCAMIARLGPEEASTLVHAFSDLEESLRLFLDEQLPKLADPAMQGEGLENLLLDIREEFRHVLYHLHDPVFFRAVEPTHDWLVLAETVKK